MKMRYFTILLLIYTASFWGASKTKKTALKYSTYTYSEETSGKTVTTTWKIQEKNNKLHIEGTNPSNVTVMTCSSDYALEDYNFYTTDKQTNYTLKRNNNVLIAKGMVNGNEMEKENSIGNSAWVQQFGFGLKPFAQSNNSNFSYYSVDPKNFSVNRLIATKKQVGDLTINNKTYKAIEIHITLPGFESLFWSATIWFDTEDGTFLMYKGNDGPNTPTSTIALISKK